MSRFDEIADIYDHKLPQLRDPQVWEQTLRLTSNFWRLNFCEAMLLVAQNPKAEMCGTLTQWNNVGRYVKRGEHSTVVFRSRTDTQLMYLFDVRQTYGTAYNTKWKMSEKIADGIVGKYNSEHSETAVSFEDFLQKSLDKNIDVVYNYDSKLNSAISNDPRIALFVRQSAEFICMTRCGIPNSYDFSNAEKFDSDLSIVEIGNAATVLAQSVLREIDGIVRRKEYEHYEAGVCGRHLRYPLRGRPERAVPPDIHELRQSADDSAGAQGGRPDERTRPDSAGYGEHQRTVSPNMERNREESGKRPEQHDTHADEENHPQPELLGERSAENGDRHGGAVGGVGVDTDERGVAGGGSPEPWEADGDTEDQHEYDDEELTDEDDETVSDEMDTVSVFSDTPFEISPDSDYAKKLLDEEILHGSGYSNGKFRIRDYILENSPTRDELAKFLKNEYGIGGSSRNDDPVSFSNHDSKGIELVLDNKTGERQVVRFTWKKVAEAVRRAFDSGKYITESDIEALTKITSYNAQHFSIHYEFPNCLDNDRLSYIRKEISDCGLDIQINLNADMFAVYAAECVRTKDYIRDYFAKIDRSSINIPYKFNDWSEASQAVSTLPQNSGYSQFREMCRGAVSELISELSSHTGHNPKLGFTDEEAAEFFSSGEALTDSSIDKIAAEVFGYLYNWEQHDNLDKSPSYVMAEPARPAEQLQLSLFGDNEVTPEDPIIESADEDTLTAAKEYIKDFCDSEYGSEADFSEISHIPLAYTTDEETDTIISVYADLVEYRIVTEFGGNIVRDEQYESLEDIAEKALKYLDFSDLVSLADDEKIISEEDEVRHGAASEPVSTIPETFRQDISQHRLIRISEPHKTVTDYPISDAGSNELSNYRLSFITDYNAYRLIADSPKVGPGVYVHQFTYKDTAESIYAYLHERDMQAFHEEAAENPAIQVRHRVAPPVGNYHFPEDFSYPSGPKAKYTANVTAIKTLKQIESEHRHATAEEQDILAHYSGWGGVADAFDPDKKNWSKEYAELKDLLTDKEYSAARESTLTAFYTEPYIIDNLIPQNLNSNLFPKARKYGIIEA